MDNHRQKRISSSSFSSRIKRLRSLRIMEKQSHQSDDKREKMDAPTNKEEAPAVRALLAPPATLSRTESFPHGVTKPRSWAHHIYQCIRTTKLDMGKVHTQGWESVLSQWFPHRLVCLSCDPRRVTWKAEIEYGSSLSKRKPILEHDSSPLEAQAPNLSKEESTSSGL